MVSRIEARVRLLAVPGFSQMGRPGLVKGTRELVVPPYIVVYKVREAQEIVVLSVVHGAQDRRP
jgi:plasmid stabilization system protein ParE